jgi:hypothetical protein
LLVVRREVGQGVLNVVRMTCRRVVVSWHVVVRRAYQLGCLLCCIGCGKELSARPLSAIIPHLSHLILYPIQNSLPRLSTVEQAIPNLGGDTKEPLKQHRPFVFRWARLLFLPNSEVRAPALSELIYRVRAHRCRHRCTRI